MTTADHARHEHVGIAFCVLSASCFALLTIVAKLAYGAGANVVTLLAARYAIAAAVLWLLAARRGVARVPSRRATLAVLGIGVLYAVESGLFFFSLTRLRVSLAELLLYAFPALVVVGSIVLRRERASRLHLGAVAVATVGVALVLGGGAAGTLDPLAVACALAAAALYATYVLASHAFAGRVHPLVVAALICTAAGVTFTGAGAASGTLRLALPLAAWGWIALIALASTVVAMSAFLAGSARLGPGRAAILATLEAPLTLLGALLVFGDQLSAPQLAGAACVVVAALAVQARAIRSGGRGASARPAARSAARALARGAARRPGLGVRAEVGRLPRARIRRRERDPAPVARR